MAIMRWQPIIATPKGQSKVLIDLSRYHNPMAYFFTLPEDDGSRYNILFAKPFCEMDKY